MTCPRGPPLHWYAGPEAVFLCCTEASWMRALSAFDATRADGNGIEPDELGIAHRVALHAGSGRPAGDGLSATSVGRPNRLHYRLRDRRRCPPQRLLCPAAATRISVGRSCSANMPRAWLRRRLKRGCQPLPPQQTPVDLNFGIPLKAADRLVRRRSPVQSAAR